MKTAYGKRTALPVLAESWELSAHPDGDGVIACGEFAGDALFPGFAAEHPEALGGNCAGAKEFPILIKLIDAARFLSIQVHPGRRLRPPRRGGARQDRDVVCRRLRAGCLPLFWV